MIVESVVVGLAVVGGYTACRCVHQQVACWLQPHRSNEAERPQGPVDPTPSFTVELVRTVLEHQGRREDQSRREMALLMSKLAAVVYPAENAPMSIFETEKAALSDGNGFNEPNTRNGVGWTIRKLLPWRT